MSRGQRIEALAGALFAGMLAAAAATAASPATQVYGGVAGATQGKLASATAGSPSSGGGGQLPFTGLNLALAAVVVVVLLACGLALRRAGRQTG